MGCWTVLAGKNTTAEEVEEMLESGNAQIFTDGVSSKEPFSFSNSDICSAKRHLRIAFRNDWVLNLEFCLNRF